MYDDVLVATDGSDPAWRAVEEAITVAEGFDATLHVLYVVDTTASAVGADADVLTALEDEGKRVVDDTLARASAADVTVEGTVGAGAPHEAILAAIEERGADVVVVGTHGRTGLERTLLGSVAERVVRGSPVRVLTVGPTPSATARTDAPIE